MKTQYLLETFCEVIDRRLSGMDAPSLDFLLSSIRGLIMLLLLADIDCLPNNFEKVVQLLKLCHDQLRNKGLDYATEFPVKLI